ncbi:photosynthetic reaction center cytochrome PufC [Thiocapsa sp.]|uniref:photosynthetic reaction center cytochrome PufC n=1 Tax=Thiocapsa sp. TaxID=2024551 RepID=UPI002B6B1FE4|nr:photosynthetic reaction center cytochrome PufC [Thiocapsa sp.]HSO83861.1 photosynthetic reaction center cytochrome PufC [Thiocapsa sp.]
MIVSFLSLVGCDRTESVQWGERGTSMIHIDKPGRLQSAADLHSIPPPEPRDPPDPEIPLAKDVNENVQVLTDLDALEFARLMQAMSTWVAPNEGCEYCHNTENLASDEKYAKVVSRQMLRMTRDINTNWKSHVAGTGVTCWTCHRGQAVPSGTWYTNLGPQTPSAGITGVKAGQNTAGMHTVGNASLPFDPLTPFLEGDTQVSIQGTTALPSDNRNSIKKAEWTYALMMYMSNSLGVNCTYCHQTRAMGVWEQSTPQRVTAWHGIRMVRDLNGDYLNPLKTLYPPERLGPTGDAPKVACDTCHKGAFKPLLGVSMLGDYPELAGYRTERPGAVPAEEPATELADKGTEGVLIAAAEDVQPQAQEGMVDPAAESVSESVSPDSDAGVVEETLAETAVESDAAEEPVPQSMALQSEEPAVGDTAASTSAEVTQLAESEALPALEEVVSESVGDTAELVRLHESELRQVERRLAAAGARLQQERTALQQQLAVVRDQRDASTTDAEVQIAQLLEESAEERSAALRAAEARLDQERTALQQQLEVVRGQRDGVAADAEVQVAKLAEGRAAALRAAGARLDQERIALQQQLAVVRAQRDTGSVEAETQVAKLSEERAAALRAAGARLDQERTALQQQLTVVRGQRAAVAAEAEMQIAKLDDERAATLRAAGARLDQERTALQQQLEVVRGQRDAVAAEAEAQIAKLAEGHARALRAAGARLDQERVALQQQLDVVRGQREAALADTESESQIAALTEEMDALRAKLAEADGAAADLRAQMQAAATEHARELAEAKGSIARIRTLYEGAAEVGGRITAEGILVNLGGEELRFPSGSAVLPAGALPTLDRIAEMLAARPDLKAKIAGHTDSLGNPEINQALSRQRAESVMRALIERGVDAGRLSTEGYGAERPIADNTTDRGRRENRRVEIVMIEQAGNGAASNLNDG